jgi:large subunit ribosomal protein L20
MPRVKRGTIHVKRRRNILAKTKGYRYGRGSQIKKAKEAAVKAGAHAYRDRRKKKSDARGLWQIKIGAFAQSHGLSYSRLMNLLRTEKIELDRKILADLAVNHPDVLAEIIRVIKK